MGLNLSAGFGGLAQGLSQAVGVKAQQELEAMKDARAENLARLSFQWKAQHDDNIQTRQEQHDSDTLDRQLTVSKENAKYTADRDDKRSDAAIRREGMILSESGRRQQAALDAASDRQDKQLTRAEEVQRKNQLFQLHDQQRREAAEMDLKEQRLRQDLQKGMAGNPAIAYEQDPVKKAKLIADDPTLGGIASELADLKSTRKKSMADYVMRAADLGDPRFTGVTDAQLGVNPAPDPSSSVPSSIGMDPTQGMLPSPTVGPMPQPITQSLGPLKPPGSLIQFGPGANADPSDPTQSPSLIQ